MLSRDEKAIDHLLLTVERAAGQSSDIDESLARAIEKDMRLQLMVRLEVAITDPSTLPRTFSKSKRVVDNRH